MFFLLLFFFSFAVLSQFPAYFFSYFKKKNEMMFSKGVMEFFFAKKCRTKLNISIWKREKNSMMKKKRKRIWSFGIGNTYPKKKPKNQSRQIIEAFNKKMWSIEIDSNGTRNSLEVFFLFKKKFFIFFHHRINIGNQWSWIFSSPQRSKRVFKGQENEILKLFRRKQRIKENEENERNSNGMKKPKRDWKSKKKKKQQQQNWQEMR